MPKNTSKNKRKEEKQSKRSKQKQNKSAKSDSQWNDHLKQFQDYIALKKLQIRDIVGDGNCLFRAISDQIENNENNHQKYRQIAVDYLRKNQNTFQNFIIDDLKYEEYLGVWGDHIEIQALSMALNIKITVHQLNAPAYIFNNDCDKEINISYHELNEDYQHYSSIYKSDETISKVNELTELIEKISDVKLNEPVKPIKYPRNQKCYCGSNKVYKKCCLIENQIEKNDKKDNNQIILI